MLKKSFGQGFHLNDNSSLQSNDKKKGAAMENKKASTILYVFLLAVLIIVVAAALFFGIQKIENKGAERGILRNDIYYFKSGNDFYLWTEEKRVEKIQQPEKKTAVHISQGVIYLEDDDEKEGNLYFRPESGEDANLEGKRILLMENTDMEYLIFDENGQSDYLIGWASKYREERVNTTLIWRLLFDEDRSVVTGVELIDKLQ